MISLPLLVGCSHWFTPAPPSPRSLQLRCEAGELQACYQLRADPKDIRREIALMKACAQGYRDTCRIYYDWQIQKPGVVPQGSAFSAAVRGCLKSGDISLCEATLDFEQRDPARFTPMIDRRRTEIEGVLAEASKSGGLDAR